MGLLDDIRQQNTNKGPQCPVKTLLDNLEKEDAYDLIAAFADPNIFATHIATALRLRDHKISDYTIARHRRGGCSCR